VSKATDEVKVVSSNGVFPIGTTFFTNVSGLTPATTYTVKAWARNSAGTGYGDPIEFTTKATAAVIPKVTTENPTDITETTFLPHGNITDLGSSTVTRRGFQWGWVGTDGEAGTGQFGDTYDTGVFMVGSYAKYPAVSGLAPGEKYRYRAYAQNATGTGYGEWVYFNTKEAVGTIPTVETLSPSDITANSALPRGDIKSTGGSTVTERGFLYGQSTSSFAKVFDSGIFPLGQYAKYPGLSGLSAGKTYYVKAYAKNAIGTGYGEWLSFNTLAAAYAPTVRTLTPTSITSSTVSPQGYIDSTGGLTVTTRGFQYGKSTSSYSTTYDTGVFAIGPFTKSPYISGLSKGTTYYIRAFANNSKGRGYGAWMTFRTN
jgi:hypothetical protein